VSLFTSLDNPNPNSFNPNPNPTPDPEKFSEKIKMLLNSLLASIFVSSSLARPQTKAPPLGFNTWNEFACNINETLVKRTADLLISTGLRDAGYVYVNLDDCWAEMRRDKNGYLVANATAFPSGLKALGDYLHDRGLLFGMYSDRGIKTCAGYF
jgi:alpha-galactosidase